LGKVLLKMSRFKIYSILQIISTLVVVAAITFYSFVLMSKNVKIDEMLWTKDVYTEKYELVVKECWEEDIPFNANLITKTRKPKNVYQNHTEYDYWYSYSVNEWIPGELYTSSGRKGDTEFWPETHTSELNRSYPSIGDVRVSKREERYYIVSNGIKYEITKQQYNKFSVGDYIYI